ncbi:MAG: HAMP domain-containing histidine kinase [Bacteroidales bacterium]|jgi:signal transduction histidine kinase|nr:HAMP domain-containing histidine kinase [Bacteroidales bacterium]
MNHRSFFNPRFFILSSLACIALAIVLEATLLHTTFSEQGVNDVETVVHKKQKQVHKYLQKLAIFADTAGFEQFRDFYNQHETVFEKQKIAFFVVKHNQLVFWSTNAINFPIDSLDLLQLPTVFIDHSWFLNSSLQTDSCDLYLLTTIKTEYAFENDYIHNVFQSDFGINASIAISNVPRNDFYAVNDAQGNFVLGLSKQAEVLEHPQLRNGIIILYALSLLLALMAAHKRLLKIINIQQRALYLTLFVVVALALRVLMQFLQIPHVFYTTDLFNPLVYAHSWIIPSLGDLCINSLLLLFVLWHIAEILKRVPERTLWQRIAFVCSVNVFMLGVLYLIRSLIFDSTLQLELYNLLSINYLSFIAYFIIGVLLLAYAILCFSFYSGTQTLFFNKKQGILVVCVSIAVFTVLAMVAHHYVCYVLLFFTVFVLLFELRVSRNIIKIVAFTGMVVFTMLYCNIFIQEKHIQIKRIVAENLTNEKDLIAEMLLKGIKPQMKTDTMLQDLLLDRSGNEAEINQYLQKTYFSGFLKKYTLESTICGSGDYFTDNNQLQNCEEYFTHILQNYATPLSNSSYYFLNNPDGNISYFDSLYYIFPEGDTAQLYIELHAKRLPEELGYPSLLLRDGVHTGIEKSQYSYAKYKDSLLMTNHGRFMYPLNLSSIRSQNALRRVSHEFVQLGEHTIGIVSHRTPSLLDLLYWTSYIFVFYALVFLLPYYIVQRYSRHKQRASIADKVKYVIVVFVLLSLLITIVCLGWFSRQQNRSLQTQITKQMQSILVDFTNHYGDSTQLTAADKDQVEALLIDFSNTFFTDIHIYDTHGNLFASSRPEIFEYQLIGRTMNPQAYYRLVVRQLPEFATKESIGDLQFTSTYSVILNTKGEILGYLNVPYFTKQYEHTQQIASLIVAIVNSYVLLLLLATLVVVGISNTITNPLRMLRDTMRQVKFGENNQKIEWHTADEIGELIENYNVMIDKLGESAKRLAESERESAWREMARQIAHDIKNPLTPMKLNMQMLQRFANNKPNDFDERLQKISNSMLEQIDVLTATANSFSDFAKISSWNPERYELTEQIRSLITLFEQHEHVQIYCHIAESPIYIVADKEKIARLVTNLITNAVQAISQSKQGEVHVNVELQSQQIRIAVTDNGNGINPEVIPHIFEFHFTTKSTGSGLGLAICKNIVENAKGHIYFETQQGQGTTFFVELPVG